MDYHTQNKVTVKKKYSMPNVADLFDRLANGSSFIKLDLQSGNWQVRMLEWMKQRRLRDSFEFLVMPFGLPNANDTFCNLTNDVLYEFLINFVVL